MAVMMSSRYDTIRPADAGDGPARKAVGFENRFVEIAGETLPVKRMVGLNIARTAAVPARPLV